jgi:Spy/CpxP family protein refolding chaperone
MSSMMLDRNITGEQIMKAIKVITITLIVVVGVSATVAVFAGGMRRARKGRFGFMGPGMLDAKTIVDRFKEPLNLTEEQEAEILPIIEVQVEEWRTMFDKYREQAHQGMQSAWDEHQELWQATEQQLAEILTEEQMQELQKMHDARMAGFQRRGRGFAGRGQKFWQLARELDLSEAQKQELFTIFMEHRGTTGTMIESVVETGKEMTTLLLNEDFDEAKVRELFQKGISQREEAFVDHAKMVAEMKTVLTPEQVEMLQQKGTEFFENVQNRMHTRHAMFDRWFPSHKR